MFSFKVEITNVCADYIDVKYSILSVSFPFLEKNAQNS